MSWYIPNQISDSGWSKSRGKDYIPSDSRDCNHCGAEFSIKSGKSNRARYCSIDCRRIAKLTQDRDRRRRYG